MGIYSRRGQAGNPRFGSSGFGADGCLQSGTVEAQADFSALHECLNANGGARAPCQAEYRQCFDIATGDETCADINACAGACDGGDVGCRSGCLGSGTAEAQRAYWAALDCFIANGGDQALCPAEVTACLNPVEAVDYCRLDFPGLAVILAGRQFQAYGVVYEPGITDRSPGTDADPSLIGEFGVGPDGSMPSDNPDWLWSPGAPNPGWNGDDRGEPNNDEYLVELGVQAPGAYDMAWRFSADAGATWVYCDGGEGSTDGYDPDQAGQLTVRPMPEPEPGDIRLVGGETPNAGRVEIYLQDQWGTVCDDRAGQNDSWGIENADVVCRQLGYPGAVEHLQSFGGGADPIWLDEVACVGNEARLLDCPANEVGENSCAHVEDVGVRCATECREDADCSDTQVCHQSNSEPGSPRICMERCDPFAAPCAGADQVCHVFGQGRGVCARPGPRANGGDCAMATSCASGLCVGEEGEQICYPMCDARDGSGCGADEMCVDLGGRPSALACPRLECAGRRRLVSAAWPEGTARRSRSSSTPRQCRLRPPR